MKPKSQVKNGLISTAVIRFQTKNITIPCFVGERSFQVTRECRKNARIVARLYAIILSSQRSSLELKIIRARKV